MTQARITLRSLAGAVLLLAIPLTVEAGNIGGTIRFRGMITQPTEPLRRVHTSHPLSIAAPMHISRKPVADVPPESSTDLLDYFADYAHDEADIVTARYH